MEGKLGQLIAQIQGNGFKVAALKMIRIQTDEAERFFQSYRGVWEDYPVGESCILEKKFDIIIFSSSAGAHQTLHVCSCRRRRYRFGC